ncbi:MAG: hypothetical protein CAPSK01_001240 [Candidatus Accumulibacter vicinus]|uniref:Uncharacterized protein n=1 Tax=Candidatus Accumulibacter vicinus TaxID=2954382 RepID=A0A084Y2V5_9PROT|nr:MAG: hypothetical protein CAPSK01_001240 [Candidatus Accumulibacter vicinus]
MSMQSARLLVIASRGLMMDRGLRRQSSKASVNTERIPSEPAPGRSARQAAARPVGTGADPTRLCIDPDGKTRRYFGV